MKTINTFYPNVQLVTLKQFFKIVPVTKIPDKRPFQQFHTLSMLPDRAFIEECVPREATSSYTLRAVPMLSGDRLSTLTMALFYQSTFSYIYKRSPIGCIYDDLCTSHIEGYGETTHLVRIGPRNWMPANPEDFTIYENDKGVSLGCLASARTIIYQVYRETEGQLAKQFNESIRDIQAAHARDTGYDEQ